MNANKKGSAMPSSLVLRPNTEEEIKKARLTVCTIAETRDDARTVMEALGVIPYSVVRKVRKR